MDWRNQMESIGGLQWNALANKNGISGRFSVEYALRGLKAFKADYPEAKCYIVYGGNEQEYKDDITLLPLVNCLQNLPAILSQFEER